MSELLTVQISSMCLPGQPKGIPLMEDFTLVIQEGQVVSLVGPSGCGKTTLLRIIAGLERRFQGSIILGGTPVVRPNRQIQLVFQDSRLLPWKTVADNLLFACERDSDSITRQSLERVLGIVRLSDRRRAWPKTLSGGEESRAALARSLVDPPRLLLLDEPFRNLDVAIKYDVQSDLISFFHEHAVTVLQISHSVDDAVFMGDVVHCLSKGPMRITRTFTIDLPHPRERSHTSLKCVSAQITEYLISCSKECRDRGNEERTNLADEITRSDPQGNTYGKT